MRLCQICEVELPFGIRIGAKFCSNRCRQKNKYLETKRKKLGILELKEQIKPKETIQEEVASEVIVPMNF